MTHSRTSTSTSTQTTAPAATPAPTTVRQGASAPAAALRRIDDSVTPPIGGSLFDGHAAERFAAVLIAVGSDAVEGRDELLHATRVMRKRAYIDAIGRLAAEHADGETESDDDDARSIVFGVVEHTGSTQRLVATVRLILKGRMGGINGSAHPLPIEQVFSSTFASAPAPAGSVEVSRLIVHHSDRAQKIVILRELLAFVMDTAVERGLGPGYAEVEKWFLAYWRDRLGLVELAGPVRIDKYDTDYMAVRMEAGARILPAEGLGSIRYFSAAAERDSVVA